MSAALGEKPPEFVDPRVALRGGAGEGKVEIDRPPEDVWLMGGRHGRNA